MGDFIETFGRQEINSYFEIEQDLFDSDFMDHAALIFALKMLFLGGFKERGKFLLKRCWKKNAFPHNWKNFITAEYAKSIEQYAEYFTDDFKKFIETGII